jgi:hypothetical protein
MRQNPRLWALQPSWPRWGRSFRCFTVSKPTRPESSAPASAAQPNRARGVALLFSTGALLSTSALFTALEPKLPPFRGD